MSGTMSSTSGPAWRRALYAAAATSVVLVSIGLCESDVSLVLYLFVAVPLLLAATIYLLITTRKNYGRRLPVLSALIVLWAISASLIVYDFKNPTATRTRARWLLWSQRYKEEVLKQPASRSGDFKHIDWDGWGMFAQDTSIYLVFDPTDSLLKPAIERQSGNFKGIPCETQLVTRLEDHWYVVLFYTDETWGQCN
jgi:hypothetical protein